MYQSKTPHTTAAQITETEERVKKQSKKKMLFLRYPLKEQIVLAKRLSLLVKSGVSLLVGLRMLTEQSNTKGRTYILETVTKKVETGQYLSASLASFGKIFGSFFINIIAIGELSGTLQQNLMYLSEELAKRLALRRKVRGAMIYPAIIITATFSLAILLTVFLFPRVLPIFNSFDDFQLPFATKVMIGLSGFIISYWIWLVIGAVLLVFAFILALRNYKFRYQYHRLLLKLPLVGALLQRYYLANISRTFGLLLHTDVRIVRALEITAETTMNLVYRRHLEAIAKEVVKGQKIAIYMREYPKLFPKMMVQMIEVAETTGALPDTFNFLAEMYENEVDDITNNLSTIVEPALMILMGIVVGFVAVAIITPIYTFTQSIKP